MVFITHCWKSLRLSWLPIWLGLALLGPAVAGSAHAQTLQEHPTLQLERADDALWLSTQLRFEPSEAIADAVQKGIPIYFVAEVELLRERWYWSNKKIAKVRRQFRLAYQPLTRRWRLSITTGEAAEAAQGLALNQNFDTWTDALGAVRRISRWRIADAGELEAGDSYRVDFRFWLDLNQLPRPLQIGTLGQSEWSIVLSNEQRLGAELLK